MKESTKFTKVVMFILLAGVLLYLGIYAARSLTDSFATTIAYWDTLDVSMELTGVIVREEETLTGGSSDIVDIVAAEGARVAVGEKVALLYQDGAVLDRQEELSELKQELEQLQSILSSDLEDMVELEQQILQSIVTLRQQAVHGELSALESNAQILRTLVLQQAFASSEDSSLTAALAQAISDLESQISALSAQPGSSTTALTSSVSGLFSRTVDGLESVLTPAALLDMSPSQLKAAVSAPALADGVIGKVVTGDVWYFAAIVDEEATDQLSKGDKLLLAFSSDFNEELSVEVEQLGSQEDGQRVLVLSSDQNLSKVLQLREQTVELILTCYEGIRVPQKALRIEEQAGDDGETVQVTGVYTVVGARAQFNPVDIVAAGSDYYLVTPATEDSSHLLHAGDEVIVTASGLYDGKVVIE